MHTQGCTNRAPLTGSLSLPTAPELPEQAFPSALTVSAANTHVWLFQARTSGFGKAKLRLCSDVQSSHTQGHCSDRSAGLYGHLSPPRDTTPPSQPKENDGAP